MSGESFEVQTPRGEIPVELVDWWEHFQHADTAGREHMLRPDEAPKKKRRRSRGRGRKDSRATVDAPDAPSSSSEH